MEKIQLQEEKQFNFVTLYLKGICVSTIISLILILILAALLTFTPIKESIINPAIIFISMFSILISSFMIGKKIKKKGILSGTIFGLVFMLLLYLISSFINMQFSLNTQSILMIGLGILGGTIGGILGVNVK